MLLRKVLFVAAATAALVWTPADLTAQERGLDRAATASAGAEANQKANSGKVIPKGIAKRFQDETLPPGIRRTRGGSDEDVEPDPEVEEPDPEVEEPDPEVEENCTVTELPGLPPVIECTSTP